jgi:hypothetical protein
LKDASSIAADPFAPDAREAVVEPSPEATADATHRRRGWRRLLQVNLLMVLVALALVSAYFAMRRNFLVPYLEQKEAREELARRGAQFSAVPASPRWVQTLFQISDDDFQDVEMIKLEHSDGIRDADLVHLHKFPHLERLYLAATRITDDGLKHLRYCTKLRRISLWDTHVGDAGIRELETLRDLRIIDIHRTWTTDDALETLGRLPALEELILDDATTKRGIAHLSGLRNLRRLSLRTTSLEADCLVSLRDCPIEILEQPRGFATRETAKNFRHVPRLRELYLWVPGATDEDLEWLAAMENLRMLQLHELHAEGDFARHVAKMQRLESLEVRSDRLRKEALFQMISAPRLREATIAAPLTEEDLTRIPKRQMSLRIYSPWLAPGLRELRSSDLRHEPRIEIVQGFDSLDAKFANGEAGAFFNRVPNYATVERLAPLLRQANLRELTLANWDFAPEALAALAKLERLESVTLINCRFFPEELIALAELPELSRFHIGDAPVGDAELAAFAGAPKLRSLEIHLTDARPKTVLELVRKESLDRLVVSATTLDDAFLDEAEFALAPRARREAEGIARREVASNPGLSFAFFSPGFTPKRAEAFRGMFSVAVGLAEVPGIETPGEYRGLWPGSHEKLEHGRFGWIDDDDDPRLELSPLKFPELPQSERAAPGDNLRYACVSRQFASARTLYPTYRFDVQDATGFENSGAPRRRSWHERLNVPAFGEGQHTSRTRQVPLDRIDAASVSLYLRDAPTSLSLNYATLPSELLEDLALSPAHDVTLSEGFAYDAPILAAIARMPQIQTLTFSRVRKPTTEELRILYGSPTLRAVTLEHDGEPIYFDDVRPAAARTGLTLQGKIVYDAEDAIRERPNRCIFANFDEKQWPAILADPDAIMTVHFPDDWPNQTRLRLQLEVLQRERDEAAKAEPAAVP